MWYGIYDGQNCDHWWSAEILTQEHLVCFCQTLQRRFCGFWICDTEKCLDVPVKSRPHGVSHLWKKNSVTRGLFEVTPVFLEQHIYCQLFSFVSRICSAVWRALKRSHVLTRLVYHTNSINRYRWSLASVLRESLDWRNEIKEWLFTRVSGKFRSVEMCRICLTGWERRRGGGRGRRGEKPHNSLFTVKWACCHKHWAIHCCTHAARFVVAAEY